MEKIILIGSGGAGKSTLAFKLGERLGIEVFHLDRLFWKANWVKTDSKYKIELQKKLLKNSSWIIDGNYGGTLNMRIEAADTIIFLDINRIVCIYQVLKRVRRYYGLTRPDLQDGCTERLDFAFLKWVWNFPKNQKVNIEKKLQSVSNEKQIIVLKNKKQIQNFLNEL